jgi:hypothetical protein
VERQHRQAGRDQHVRCTAPRMAALLLSMRWTGSVEEAAVPNEELDIPDWLLGYPGVSGTWGRRDERRLGAIPMIVGTIRWSGTIGRPDGPLDQAFAMFVERLEVTPLEEVDPRQPQPYACNVTFKDATDEQGPCVSFVVHGLRLLGYDHYPRNPHGHNMNGGYLLTPSLQARWGGPLGARAFLGRLEFTPSKWGTPLTENAPVADIHFILAPHA